MKIIIQKLKTNPINNNIVETRQCLVSTKNIIGFNIQIAITLIVIALFCSCATLDMNYQITNPEKAIPLKANVRTAILKKLDWFDFPDETHLDDDIKSIFDENSEDVINIDIKIDVLGKSQIPQKCEDAYFKLFATITVYDYYKTTKLYDFSNETTELNQCYISGSDFKEIFIKFMTKIKTVLKEDSFIIIKKNDDIKKGDKTEEVKEIETNNTFVETENKTMKNSFPIMLKFVSKEFKLENNQNAIFRSGVEESLTENKYSLISEEVQEETLKEQAIQRNKECLEESCLVDTGKMLAARGLFIIEVIKSKNDYLFKIKYINLETAETLKTKSLIYTKDIDNAQNLLDFAKELTKEVLK